MALDNYEEVPDRIRRFFEKYPDGSLQTKRIEYKMLPVQRFEIDGEGKRDLSKPLPAGEALHVIYHAAAYRSPGDPRPGHGVASEPIPGLTAYTRDSEVMNAETSAWGRALVALGFVAKSVASANEVRARQGDSGGFSRPKVYNAQSDPGEAPSKAQLGRVRGDLKKVGVKTAKEFSYVAKVALGVEVSTADKLTKAQASYLIDWLGRNPVPTGESDVPSDSEGFQESLGADDGDDLPWSSPDENTGEKP